MHRSIIIAIVIDRVFGRFLVFLPYIKKHKADVMKLNFKLKLNPMIANERKKKKQK